MNARTARAMRRLQREAAASASQVSDGAISTITDSMESMLLLQAANQAVCMAASALVLRGMEPRMVIATVQAGTLGAMLGAIYPDEEPDAGSQAAETSGE